MLVKKGQKLEVNHSRKGKFFAIAEEDFNTDDRWMYLVIAKEQEIVEGINKDWKAGEKITCRSSLASIKII